MKSDGAPSRAPSSFVPSSCRTTAAPSPASPTPSSSTAADRERLAARIRTECVAIAVAAASVAEIARWNIYQDQCAGDGSRARRLARGARARRGAGRREADQATLGRAASRGRRKATRSCYSIACASIVAKVVRDRLMTRLAARHPAYGWERNAGYGTPTHIAALRVAGLTPHHRLSFCRTALGGQLEL
jgi:ribonuclease HII